MFCNNCGSKLPDGSRFCSVCGAKLVDVAVPVAEKPSRGLEPEMGYTTDAENKGYKAGAAKVYFDWSNLKDEPVKREVPDIPSPWDTPEVEEQPVARKAPSQDHSRTMSFIEILKAEREEKLQAADKEARAVTEREETPFDYSPFEEKPSLYVPPLYQDVQAPSEPLFEEPVFEEPKYAEPVEFEAPVYREFEAEPISEVEKFEEEPVASPFAAPFADFEPAAGKHAAPASPEDLYAEPIAEEPVEEVNIDRYFSAEEDIAASEPDKLSAELDAILNAAVAKPAEKKESIEDLYAEPVVEAPVIETPAVEAPVIETPAVEVPVAEKAEESVSLEDLFDEIPATEKDRKSTIAAPAEDEDEIEALKRRLAELMGTPAEPVEIEKKETASLEELVADEPAELEIPVEKPVIEPAEVKVPVVEEPVEAPADDDVLSLDDLEKELFGEASIEDVEAEATKKIDKFYTLYKKNEEFQKLLDEEYNKLKADEEAEIPEAIPAEPVKVVEEAPAVEEPVEIPAVPAEPVKAAPVVEEIPAVPVEEVKEAPAEVPAPVEEVEEPKKLSKKEARAAAKAAKAELAEDEEESSGGGALTVIAVIIALLLIALLAVILILNFAPDSGIAMKLDSLIENVASFFSATDVFKNGYLL